MRFNSNPRSIKGVIAWYRNLCISLRKKEKKNQRAKWKCTDAYKLFLLRKTFLMHVHESFPNSFLIIGSIWKSTCPTTNRFWFASTGLSHTQDDDRVFELTLWVWNLPEASMYDIVISKFCQWIRLVDHEKYLKQMNMKHKVFWYFIWLLEVISSKQTLLGQTMYLFIQHKLITTSQDQVMKIPHLSTRKYALQQIIYLWIDWKTWLKNPHIFMYIHDTFSGFPMHIKQTVFCIWIYEGLHAQRSGKLHICT